MRPACVGEELTIGYHQHRCHLILQSKPCLDRVGLQPSLVTNGLTQKRPSEGVKWPEHTPEADFTRVAPPFDRRWFGLAGALTISTFGVQKCRTPSDLSVHSAC
eukprot:9503813-Pyramimonas_sp.AAC.2